MRKQILIVEENREELRKLRKLLSSEGYNIMTAMDKETAIEICNNLDIAFILSSTSILDLKKPLK
jgi:PleD family two-component response regulator